MASMKLLVPLLLAIMVVSAPPTESALTCSTVTNTITPCVSYLMGGALSAGCCSSIRSLNAAAQTTPDRQTACRCLKNAANSFTGVNVDAAAGLPAKCGVNIPYKISPSTDCDSEDFVMEDEEPLVTE